MKDKILIGLILLLVLALCIESAYLIQLKYDKEKIDDINLLPKYRRSFGLSRIKPGENRYSFDFSFGGDPFNEMEKIHKRMNMILQNNFIFEDESKYGSDDLIEKRDSNEFGFSSPDINLTETPTHYIVKVFSPDIEKDKINLEIKDNLLIVSGEHNIKKERKSKGFYTQSKSFGAFTKTVPLPGDVQVDKVTTEYEKDFLVIRLPKAFENNAFRKATIESEL